MTKLHLFLIILISFSCRQKKENRVAKEDDKVSRAYFKSGKLKTEIRKENGLKQGVSKSYYENGKPSLEITYDAGKKTGTSKRYYETGVVYQETEYKDDIMDGVRRKYWEDGTLLSEEHYQNNFPCGKLKEFGQDGKLKSGYPSLIIAPVDRLKEEGTFVLNLSLSNKSKRVKYYKGRLSSAGCLTGTLEALFVDNSTGIGQARYYLSPGEFKMEEVNIIAAYETPLKNTYLTQKVYHLSIQN